MLKIEELKRRFYEYMNKYEQTYIEMSSDEEFYWLEESVSSFLVNNFVNAYLEPMVGDSMFQQIFVGIDALPNEANPFYQMMKRIEEEYGLDRDIIDVASGSFPALAYEIAKRKKELGIEKGSITAFDPRLVTTKLDGIKLIKDKFTLATPVSKETLLVGRKPCDATEIIVRKSSIQNLEFYIQMCHCNNHVPTEYKLRHKSPKGISIMELYIEDIARSTLPKGFSFKKEKVIEVVGEDEIQHSKETVIKTKRIR